MEEFNLMKINKFITILGFSLLVGAVAYSMQQLNVAKQTQAQMQSLISTQTVNIKSLQIQLETVIEQTKTLEETIDNNQQVNQDNLNERYIATASSANASQDIAQESTLEKQLAALTIKVKQQSKTLQGLKISINQSNGDNSDIATLENTNQSIEEMDAEADVQAEQYKQNMENYWQQQAVATEWAQTIEETARTRLVEEKGLTLDEINCKTTVCRLEITSRGETEKDVSDWVLDNIKSPEIHTQTKMNDDGSESFVIYLSKEGSSLLANIN